MRLAREHWWIKCSLNELWRAKKAPGQIQYKWWRAFQCKVAHPATHRLATWGERPDRLPQFVTSTRVSVPVVCLLWRYISRHHSSHLRLFRVIDHGPCSDCKEQYRCWRENFSFKLLQEMYDGTRNSVENHQLFLRTKICSYGNRSPKYLAYLNTNQLTWLGYGIGLR